VKLITRKNPTDRRRNYTSRERYDRWRCRRRYDVAGFLTRFRRWCWCTLADWAMHPTQPRDVGEEHAMLLPRENFPRPMLFDRSQTRSCVLDASKRGSCYCGKFRTPAVQASGNFGSGGFVVPESDAVE
jgi:hypothetical protein